MYARLVIFQIGPGKCAIIEQLVNEFDPLYHARTGFRQVFISGDDATGEYGSFSVWDSRAYWSAARPAKPLVFRGA
jgi:hypothetical protein